MCLELLGRAIFIRLVDNHVASMDNSYPNFAGNRSITILPRDYARIVARKRLINSFFPSSLRLQCYGGLLFLFGLAFLASSIERVFFAHSETRRPGDFWLDLLAFVTVPPPILLGAFWYGWFLISHSQFTFSDPREILNQEWMPRCGDRITIVPRAFLGTDAALVVDHHSSLVHFLNCHVPKGFIPNPMLVYTCKIDELRIEETTFSTQHGKVTQAIVYSPIGSTRLGTREPGVIQLLGLLRESSKGDTQ